MTDVEALRNAIDASGYKLILIAKKCGLTYQGFQPKMNGERDFNQTEIATLQELLSLSTEDVLRIFFAHNVDK